MSDWKPIETAQAETEVLTKIHDDAGERNIQKMVRHGNLWWINGGQPNSMYVYYTPTH
jgi:hypothetical protein